MPTVDMRPHYYVRDAEDCVDIDGAYTRLRDAVVACNGIVRETGLAHYVARTFPDGWSAEDEIAYIKEPKPCRP